MITNKEKALKLIEEAKCEGYTVDKLITAFNARQAVNLASKPDWYYPSKGEFPKDNSKILEIDKGIPPLLDPVIRVYREYEKKLFIEEVEAWAYLPKFEKDV